MKNLESRKKLILKGYFYLLKKRWGRNRDGFSAEARL